MIKINHTVNPFIRKSTNLRGQPSCFLLASITENTVSLPVCVLAFLGAVVNLLTRAAPHEPSAELVRQALGTDALARVDRLGVAERGQWRRFGAVFHAHVQEHVPHEVVAVFFDHGSEAEVEPKLAEDQPTVVEMSVHHATEDCGSAFWEIILRVIALLLINPCEFGVYALP